jgi:hypothetical protein
MGALLFVHGVLDLVLDVMFCVTLLRCGELLLLGCAATTLLATFLTTWYLGAQRRIARAVPTRAVTNNGSRDQICLACSMLCHELSWCRRWRRAGFSVVKAIQLASPAAAQVRKTSSWPRS